MSGIETATEREKRIEENGRRIQAAARNEMIMYLSIPVVGLIVLILIFTFHVQNDPMRKEMDAFNKLPPAEQQRQADEARLQYCLKWTEKRKWDTCYEKYGN